MAPKSKFVDGEKVLCFHGPLIYEAKCLKVQQKEKQTKYFIHYAGWNKNWDEWVPESRVLKLTDANLSRQKDLQKAHDASLKNKKFVALGTGKKPLGPGTGPPEKRKSSASKDGKEGGPSGSTPLGGGGDDSRSSTPSSIDRSKRSATCTPTLPAPLLPPPTGKGDESVEARKKRSRLEATVETEEQFVSSVEVRIRLPDELKPFLVDDWDLINRQHKLPRIPARITVDTIFNDYIRAKTSTKASAVNKESAAQEIVAGLREYFNVMLGTQLLYKFERPHYAEILQENPEKQMSHLYGFSHLVRLIVPLGKMLTYTQLDEPSMTLVIHHIQDFLRFLVKNQENYYNIEDYGFAPPEYHRKTS